MEKIALITDSTAYINESDLKSRNIQRVPLYVNFEGETEAEGLPGSFEGFYEKLSQSKDFPSTSQPSVGDFAKAYESFFEMHPKGEIIVVTISSLLSGTYNSACSAAKMVDPSKISVIDSLSTVANLRHMVLLADEKIKEGKSRDEIVALLEEQKSRAKVYVTVGTLNYLKKGGRLSASQAAIGSVLNIKPIITLEEGLLRPIEKVRGRKKALEKMVGMIVDKPTHFSICHINALDEAEELKKSILERHPNLQISIEQIGPVIGAHLGPKAIGYCYLY